MLANHPSCIYSECVLTPVVAPSAQISMKTEWVYLRMTVRNERLEGFTSYEQYWKDFTKLIDCCKTNYNARLSWGGWIIQKNSLHKQRMRARREAMRRMIKKNANHFHFQQMTRTTKVHSTLAGKQKYKQIWAEAEVETTRWLGRKNINFGLLATLGDNI